MKFGRFGLADAAGIVLAHGMRVGGRTFRKGRVLSAADLDLLEREGLGSVTGARIDATDVVEDAAAPGRGASARRPRRAGRRAVHRALQRVRVR